MTARRGHDRLLLLILVTSLALRWTGTWVPFDHPDEWHLAERIERAAETRSLSPGYEDGELGHFAWGGASIAAYLPAVWLPLHLDVGSEATQRLPLRLWTGLLGVFTVWVVYCLGASLRGRRFGRLAATVMAVAPLHVQVSHYVTPDVLGTLFVALALWLGDAARLPGPRRMPRLLGSSVAVGWAVATKYTLFSSGLVPLLAAWGPTEGRFRRLVVVAGAMMVAFLVAEPYALLDPDGFVRHLVVEHEAYTGLLGQELAVGGRSHLFYLLYLVRSGMGPLLCAPLAWLLWTRGGLDLGSRRTWIWLGPPILHLAFVGCFPLQYDRNVLPLFPVLAVGVAWGLERMGEKLRMIAIIGPSILVAILMDVAICAPNVRDQARHGMAEMGIASEHVWDPDHIWSHAPTNIAVDRTTVDELRHAGYRYVLVDGRTTRPLSVHPERFPGVADLLDSLHGEATVIQTWRNPIVDADWLVPRWLEHGATFPAYHGARVTLWSLDGAPSRGAQGT